MKPITVVYNEKSGSAMSIDSVRDEFKMHDLPLKRSIAIDDQLKDNLKDAIENGEYVAAIGGDGTISAVAGIVAGSAATLIPLPGGTLNNFTKDLGIAQDLKEAIAAIASSNVTKIDIASVNGKTFINNSSIGVYPQSLKTRQRTEDVLGKWPAALFGVFRAFIHFKTYEITIDGETFTTPFIFVGNNNYKLENLGDTSRNSLVGGVLSVYIIKSSKRSSLARIFFAALLRRLHDVDEFDNYLSQEVTINTKKHSRVHVSHDGEVSTLSTPIEYKTQPKTLRLLVP